MPFSKSSFGLAGHHAGEMKDDIGPAGDGGTHGRRIGNVGGGGLDFAGKSLGRCGATTSISVSFSIGWPLSAPSLDEARGELAPDHAGGAGDENVHESSRPVMLREGGHPVFIAICLGHGILDRPRSRMMVKLTAPSRRRRDAPGR